MTSERFDRDLREVLVALVPADVPASLHRHVAAVGTSTPSRRARLLDSLRPRPGEWFPSLSSVALGLVVLLLAATLSGIVFFLARGPVEGGPGSGPRALAWRTDLASLEADGLAIEVGGRTFTAAAPRFAVNSDPGTPAYRTLEMTWREQGSQMRLHLYFAADDTHWWVSEIRTYDGMPDPDWITYRGPLFRTERGASYEGDVTLTGSGRNGGGRLQVENMRLTAFLPGTGPQPFEGCRPLSDESDQSDGRDPLPEAVGMEARDAHVLLSRRGICHDFRLSWGFIGHENRGYSQRWCVPPPGVVQGTALGTQDEVVLFVEDPVERPLDLFALLTPSSVGCD